MFNSIQGLIDGDVIILYAHRSSVSSISLSGGRFEPIRIAVWIRSLLQSVPVHGIFRMMSHAPAHHSSSCGMYRATWDPVIF